MAHTPGPWLFHSSASSVSFTQVDCADGTRQGRLAASIFHPENPGRPMVRVGAPRDDASEVIANARLIAAAPDLFEALKATVSQLETMGFDGEASGANAAIAKATSPDITKREAPVQAAE